MVTFIIEEMEKVYDIEIYDLTSAQLVRKIRRDIREAFAVEY